MDILDLLRPWQPFDGHVRWFPMSTHEACLTAIQSIIQGLALPNLADESVVIRKLPIAREFTQANHTLALPGVILSPYPVETMSPYEGTNRRDDIGYPALVCMVQESNQDANVNMSRMLYWRQEICKAFRQQHLPGVDEITKVFVEPRSIFLPEAFTQGVDHSALVLRCISRETRGA